MIFCDPLFGVVFRLVVNLIPIDKGNHVRILLDGTRFPEIRHLGAPVRSIFYFAVQLGQGDDGQRSIPWPGLSGTRLISEISCSRESL